MPAENTRAVCRLLGFAYARTGTIEGQWTATLTPLPPNGIDGKDIVLDISGPSRKDRDRLAIDTAKAYRSRLSPILS
jgi:hypothetical protein